MSVKIKNCGIKTPEDARAVAKSGASFIGFVYHPTSPRHLPLEEIAELSAQVPDSLKQVLVMVDPSDDMLMEIQRHFRPHYIQVHKVTDPVRIKHINDRTALPVIAALNIASAADLKPAAALEAVSSHLLFDAKDSGKGVTADWTLFKSLALKKPWFLAGGLTAQNVAAAIRITGAPMVDVSSGIEEAPGVKSPEMIAAFNTAVLNAANA